MTLPIIAAQTGAVLLILQIVLMLTAGLRRAKTGTFVGLSDADPDLERVVRRHGNLAENAGLFVAVLALAELVGLAPSVLGVIAAVFVAARFAHAASFTSLTGSHGREGNKLFVLLRLFGAFGTAMCGFALGGFLLVALLT